MGRTFYSVTILYRSHFNHYIAACHTQIHLQNIALLVRRIEVQIFLSTVRGQHGLLPEWTDRKVI